MQRSKAWHLATSVASVIQVHGFFHLPTITEILLFGSLARGRRGEVGDVDLLILTRTVCDTPSSYDENDWEKYWCQPETLLPGFGRVHTLVFPVAVLTDAATQERIVTKQSDPRFLRNCFSSMQRWDWTQQTFVPISPSYLL